MKKKSCGRLICAAPEFCADLLYAGGFNAPGQEFTEKKGFLPCNTFLRI